MEYGDVIREYINVVTVHRHGVAILSDHVGRTDRVQAVDVDVAQTTLKTDNVGLTVLRSAEVRAGF